MNKYKENPYRAYPREMRGQFCEFKDGDNTRFIEIYSVEYDLEEISKSKKRGYFERTRIYEYMELIDGDIPSETYFLYKLETYLANPLIEDLFEFNESATELTMYGFTSFNKMLEFCHDKGLNN